MHRRQDARGPSAGILPALSGTEPCYISSVRRYAPFVVLLAVMALAGCAKNVNRQIKEAVGHFDNLDLSEDEIKILSTQELGGQAIAQVEIKTAVKLVKKKGQWVVDEVRIGDRRWEKADHIRAILRSERTQTTRKQLQTISDGVRRYLESQGTVPQVADFDDLLAILTPQYLADVTPLDAWSNAYAYRRVSPQAAEVRSSGPDGLYGTQDDLTEKILK